MQAGIRYALVVFFISYHTLSASAKTDLPMDAGTGTGGVTITGATHETNYQRNAPNLAVTAINGIPINNISSQPAPGSKAPTPEERGKEYDKRIRQSLNMPPGWFTCNISSDCVTAHVPCNTSLAVNKQYKDKTQTLLCHGECIDACAKSMPDTSQAVCKNGQCSTIIQPSHPLTH